MFTQGGVVLLACVLTLLFLIGLLLFGYILSNLIINEVKQK